MPSSRKRRIMAEINVVPYIDVMLVLLIIFMVTAPLLTQGIEVDLPTADAEPLQQDASEPLILSVDVEGNFYLNVGDNEDEVREPQQVVTLASIVLKAKPATPVLVKADENVKYGRVVTAMVLLQKAGAQKVGFLTDPAEFDPLLEN
jgi:biopolymer transport protein TolR